ncbi:MAG TPA: hypothetical protein VI756_24055 [Blastocatellia bacterium]
MTALPSATVLMHPGNDICAWLDNTPAVARSFPQLLGLRDLDELLRQRVNSDILNRSQAAVQEAKELSAVFIPTRAYEKALEVLHESHFVVLEGLPEMGKTAIGRIIMIGRLARGWVAVECREPEDFHREYRKDEPQVFFADDFFGRTEYEPSRVLKWQYEITKIYGRLDRTHWLILTSRMHLLAMGKAELDIAGLNGKFPDIGEVTVNANDMKRSEKGRVLYRHAKVANLSPQLKEMLKACVSEIVDSKYYTPERIRRLVRDWLPTAGSRLTRERLSRLVAANLIDPTRGMRKTFAALRASHRWLLASLVEAEPSDPALTDFRARFKDLCPKEEYEPIEGVVEALSGGFLAAIRPHVAALLAGREARVRSYLPTVDHISYHLSWAHPSCRDLVIEELTRRQAMREHFLSHCSVDGVSLALSVGGGPLGDRSLPLLVTQSDWNLLASRCEQLVREGTRVIETLRRSYIAARDNSGDEIIREGLAEFRKLLFDLILPTVGSLASKKAIAWSPQTLADYYAAREISPVYAPTVDPTPLVRKLLNNAVESGWVDSDAVRELIEVLATLEKHDPSYVRMEGNREELCKLAEEVLAIEGAKDKGGLELDYGPGDEGFVAQAEERAAECRAISTAYRDFSKLTILSQDEQSSLEAISDDYDSDAEAYEVEAELAREEQEESEPPYYDNEDDWDGRTPSDAADKIFGDLESLFSDL